MNWVRHGGSTTFETKSSYCRAKVEFNSINWVRHGSSTTFETGLSRRSFPASRGSHDEAKMRERRESLSFLLFLPRRERPLLVGKVGHKLPSPCTAFSRSLSVNSFRWRIRGERAGIAWTTWPETLWMVFQSLETFLNRFNFQTLMRCKAKLLEILLRPSYTNFWLSTTQRLLSLT